MIELLVLLGVLALFGGLLIGLLKLFVCLLILPFKVAFWLAKGVLALVLLVPLIVIGLNVFALGIPILLVVLCLPFILLFAGLAFVCRLIF
ncbi:MAG: hypothetical protein ABIA59_06730 [Candidatus Latescibacterota bacterium]